MMSIVIFAFSFFAIFALAFFRGSGITPSNTWGYVMTGMVRTAVVGILSLPALGCQNLQPAMELSPVTPIIASPLKHPNPVFIPLGENDYGPVFEKVLEVLGDYGFEIEHADRYDGRIETTPRIAPGLGLILKSGSPDPYERLLSTFQTYRHRVKVQIQPAEQGGYFIEFVVTKELEDLPRPIRSTTGGAVFRAELTVDRQTEVIDPTIYDPSWYYRGRDERMEQELIRRYRCQ